MFSMYQTLLLFFIYSFLGWCIEVIFVAVTSGKVQNRGFLNGPVCPIYGFGMLGVLLLLLPVKDSLLVLFLGGMIICSAVELFGGWILDKIFHMRWWDYTDYPLNIGGYICLGFSLMWGIAVVCVVRFIHPPIFGLVNKTPRVVGWIVIGVIGAVFIADMVVTLKKLVGIRKDLGQLDKIAEEMHEISDKLTDALGNSALSVANKTEKQVVESKEKWEKQMYELEERKDKLIENIHKLSKLTLSELPEMYRGGKKIRVKDYIENLRNKHKDKEKKKESLNKDEQ